MGLTIYYFDRRKQWRVADIVMSKIALYARVSTIEQSTEMQMPFSPNLAKKGYDLRRYAQQRALEIYKEYVDEGISGTKEKRPALDELMIDAHKRLFDVVKETGLAYLLWFGVLTDLLVV